MDKRDSEKIIKLVREGKEISKICDEDFSEYGYWEIYVEAYGSGERSAVGIRRKITNRINKIPTLPQSEQEKVLKEIDELIWHLYNRYRESQQKLDDIRGVVER